MSQNQEIIESKLCAFIDDELDDEGRAEIERHLLANPQHRRLLEELRRTSGLVRSLPRDAAPAELAESFNGQLERSVLLQGLGDSEGSSTTGTTRWPQMAALAAIVLLTVGLAGVVYVILPSLTRRPQIVQNYSRPPSSAAPTTTDYQAGTGDVDAITREAKSGMVADRLRSRQVRAERKLTLDEAGKVDEIALVARLREVAKQAANDPQLAQLAKVSTADVEPDSTVQTDARAAGVGANAVVMLVRAADPGQARQQLKDYFDANKIPWDAATSDAVDARGSAAKGTDEHLSGGVASTAPADAPLRGQAAKQPNASDALALGKNGLGVDKSATPAPATSPAPAGVLADNSIENARGDNNGVAPAKDGSLAQSSDAVSDRTYLACRMTRKQAQYVGSILSQEGIAQHVQFVAAPARQVSEQPALTLNLAPPAAAVDTLNAPTPTTRQAQTDDAARLSDLAGGAAPTTRDAFRSEAAKRDQGSLTHDGQGPPAAAAPLPSTSAGVLPQPEAAAESLATTEPSELNREGQQLGASLPQTQPGLALQSVAAPVPAASDDPLDVVIVLQGNAPDVGAPTTDPADAPAPPSDLKVLAAPAAAKPSGAGVQKAATQPAK